MRQTLFLLSALVPLFSFCQLFKIESEWFGLENYFNEEYIKEKNIEAIHIKIEDKQDGEIILHKGAFLHYEFNSDGLLGKSLKSIHLARKRDTSSCTYYYNKAGQLYKKTESYGPFSFSYFYFYEGEQLVKETKVDANKSTNDTLYERKYQNLIGSDEKIIQTLNSTGKPYQTYLLTFDSKNRVTREKLSFSRGGSFTEKVYSYEKDKLVKIKTESYFNQKEQSSEEILYTDNKLDYILLYEEDKLIKKRGFIYRNDGLISAIVERDYLEKNVRIYSILYRFF